jgi:type 1 glutamine amidotransferase
MARKTKAFSVDLSDQYSVFDKKVLKNYDAIVFNSSSSPNLNTDQREAILSFIRSGKGVVGIHMATDFDGWEEGTAMIGGRWNGHPWTSDGTWAFKLNDPYHQLNTAFGETGFWFQDEIYQYKPESYQGEESLRILVSLDMSKGAVLDAMEEEKYLKYQETYGEGPREVPVSWIRTYGEGRVFYTNFGHREETYTNPVVMKHLYDGILYALDYRQLDATPSASLPKIEPVLAPEKTLANNPNTSRNYQETNGIVSVEAEDFASQVLDSIRRWYLIREGDIGHNISDRDRNHASSASNKAYLEILPDTRTTHSDSLITGVNFSNEPGKMAILSYNIYFNTPGEYLVWVRAFSTGGEDNGIHVGIDGTWPESGQRIQFCPGKYQWTWSSAQRVPENHCGTAGTISITVPEAGSHNIHFSMREDGFEFDKFIMALDQSYQPESEGLAATYVPSESYAELNERSRNTFNPIFLKATRDFENISVEGFVPYYVDEARNALAINAAEEKYRGEFAAAQHRFAGEEGIYALTLYTMQETDGESEYAVSINGKEVLKTNNSATQIDYSIHEGHAEADVQLKPGDLIQITSNAPTNGLIPEGDTTAYARGRWTELMLIKGNGQLNQNNDH